MSKNRVKNILKLLLLSVGFIFAIACGSNSDSGSESSQVSLTPPDFPLVQVIEQENQK